VYAAQQIATATRTHANSARSNRHTNIR